jgi:glycogen synthase
VRIALVSTLLPDGHSGIARATRDLAGELRAQSHAVELVTLAGGRVPPGIQVHQIQAGTPLQQAVAVRDVLAALWEAGRLDVASAPLWAGEAALAACDRRFPTVVTCMTTGKTTAAISPDWGEANAQGVWLEQLCVTGARHMHGLTEAALETVQADYGGSPLTSAVVPRGLRDRCGEPAGSHAGGPVRVLFVGRLERRKGVDVLLAAARALVAQGVDFRLDLAGPDSPLTETGRGYREGFERDAPPGLRERVTFHGPVSDSDLEELYSRADLVCQPSRFESHGIVLVEAMMFGKPIVSTAAGGISEVVEEGANAMLAEPGDAISLAASLRRAIESPELRARFGARSRELYLERYEAGVVARGMVRLFAEAIEAHEANPVVNRGGVLLADALAVHAAALGEDRDAWRERAGLAERRLARLSRSRSWRLTGPLRALAMLIRR